MNYTTKHKNLFNEFKKRLEKEIKWHSCYNLVLRMKENYKDTYFIVPFNNEGYEAIFNTCFSKALECGLDGVRLELCYRSSQDDSIRAFDYEYCEFYTDNGKIGIHYEFAF